MFWVCGHFKGHLFVTLSLEEAGDFVLLVIGDSFEDFSRGIHVSS